MTFHCEMRAMHGDRCRWQCEECEDIADYQQTQRVSARTTRHVLNAMRGVPAYHPTEHQPARCGKGEG